VQTAASAARLALGGEPGAAAGARHPRGDRSVYPDPGAARAGRNGVPRGGADDTLSVDAPLEFDQTDPLAEADFHMAYGLYDQAADIVKLGLEREPGRSDYKMKLLEIFFVSGNKSRFLDGPRDRGDADTSRRCGLGSRGHHGPPAGARGSAVRGRGRHGFQRGLNLEGGASRVDLELLEPAGRRRGRSTSTWGEAFQSDGKPVRDRRECEMLDFDLGSTEPPTAEMPRFVTTPRKCRPSRFPRAMRRPSWRRCCSDPTSRRCEPVQRQGFKAESQALDSTAEMPMDDLGIDLGDFTEIDSVDDVTRLDAADSDDYEQGTAVLPKLEGGMDFDLTEASDDLAAGTATQRIDSDLVAPDAQSQTRRVHAHPAIPLDELPEMSELEPVTMSEVGTKLDLARAYVDMGDPEGARSILEEVLKEGSASQRDEAQRLIDGLPGA
jgi:FimV-like protein